MKRTNQFLTIAGIFLVCLPGWAQAKASKVDRYHWTGVDRIVAIGDIHGDYDKYIKVMKDAGLVNKRGKWTGGETHLVQTGDIPDRGPDTSKIIEHINGLKKQAVKAGGQVHTLIGNHEAMNVYGDLRYVHPGEYKAFESRNSKRYQNLQWDHYVSQMTAREPGYFEGKDIAELRATWEKDYPLGWVEHRQSWTIDGELGQFVLGNPTVLKVNDTLFLHGGLSAKYCGSSVDEINQQVHDGLKNYDYQNPGILEDELGPLWYRGLAMDNEDKRKEMVTAILERYDAKRIVVGHTVTQGIVWPRFDARVILNDTGMSAHYGGYEAFLEIKGEDAVAWYGQDSIVIPAENNARIEYLAAVIQFNPTNAHLRSRYEKMLQARKNKANSSTESEASSPTTEPAGEMSAEEARAAEAAAQKEAWLSPDNCR